MKEDPILRHSELPAVVNINADDDNHQRNKQPVNGLCADLPVQTASRNTAGNAADDHKRKHKDRKVRHASRHDGRNQAGNLREEDDVQRILRRLLRIHREEEEQDDQIDRTAADAEKARENTEHQPDDYADNRRFHLLCLDAILKNRIHQRSDCDEQKTGRLNQAHLIDITAHRGNIAEHRFSGNSANRGTDGKRQSCVHLKTALRLPGETALADRIGRHGKDRASGQETDGFDIQDAEAVENRLNNNATADAADCADRRCQKTDNKKDQINHCLPNSPSK